MDEETVDAIRDLASRHFALQAGVIALIRTHPNPQALLEELNRAESAGLSNLLTLPWQDHHVETFQSTVETLRMQIPR